MDPILMTLGFIAAGVAYLGLPALVLIKKDL